MFKYEDEFGFHYMVMDKLPGERPTYMEPISSEKMVGPIGFYYVMREGPPRGNLHIRRPSRSRERSTQTVFLELSLVSSFRRTANWLMCPAPNSSPGWVGGQIMKTFRNGGKGPGPTEPPRRRRGKGGEIPSSRKSLSLHEKQTIASAQAEWGGDLLL